ncbi:MAG: hypothetical protein LBJ01_06435, partial [Tannerella sp.]|nr:hypothetical protein [Tannerella sp.]
MDCFPAFAMTVHGALSCNDGSLCAVIARYEAIAKLPPLGVASSPGDLRQASGLAVRQELSPGIASSLRRG